MCAKIYSMFDLDAKCSLSMLCRNTVLASLMSNIGLGAVRLASLMSNIGAVRLASLMSNIGAVGGGGG